jgi:ABC-type multidrug transport system ATPase subunit
MVSSCGIGCTCALSQHSSSPAEQMDVHDGTTTVREAMRFSANLRQPFSVPQAEKIEYVEEMIELLELNDLADALVMSLGVEGKVPLRGHWLLILNVD